MGLSHQIEEYWTTLIKGAHLIKCGRRGQPHIHFFRLSETKDALVWESKGRQRKVPLSQVHKIVPGQQTQVFLRNKSNPTARGLEKEDRTLDVMCQSEEEFHLWYNALKYVTDQIRSRGRMHRGGHHPHFSAPNQASPSLMGGGQSQGFVNQNLGFPASGNVPGDCYIWGACAEGAATSSGFELPKVASPHLVPSSQKLDLIYVSCGPSHFTAVTRNGNLYTWGSGENGKLGLGAPQSVSNPTTVPKLRGVRAVSCGDCNSAAITSDGDLYTWGCGLSGQLGHGNTVPQYLPKKVVQGFADVKIRHVSCGPFHSAALSEGGGVFTWGDGFGGKLGHGDSAAQLTPKRIEGLTDVSYVSCGWWHTAAVVKIPGDDPELYRSALFTWGGHSDWSGDSNKGCLGNGAKTGEWFPKRVEGALMQKHVKSVSCGLNLTVVVTRDGGVYQMGTTAAEDVSVPWEGATQPTRVEGPLRRIYADQVSAAQGLSHQWIMVQVSCGKQHVVVVGTTSQSRSAISDRKCHVFSWGTGKRGQLGLGDYRDHTLPQFVEDLGQRKVLNVCCGGDYTLIVCAHDHKTAADTSREMIVTAVTTEYSPTGGSSLPRRPLYPGSSSNGTVVSVNQLRLSKMGALHGVDGVGSLDHISVASSSSSIRKMKSELVQGGGHRMDRARTGSTPLSDAPLEQRSALEERRSAGSYTGGVRVGTPTSVADIQDNQRQASVPDLTAEASGRPRFEPHAAGEIESVVSDPCDRDETSSDGGTSVANTDGPPGHDAYSEEESTAHRSAPSLSERTDTPVSRPLPASFRLPIMPFPPSPDVAPTTSARSLQHSLATAARLRTRQRGLERRLGITDTWTSDRLISKQSSTPTTQADLLSTDWNPSVIREEGTLTARESRRYSTDAEPTRHHRTASEQHLYLNSLKEWLKNVGDSKTTMLNYGKLLESVETRLVSWAAKKKGEIKEADPELRSVLKLLDADGGQQKKIGSFFEASTVEKHLRLIQKLSQILETAPNPNTMKNVFPAPLGTN